MKKESVEVLPKLVPPKAEPTVTIEQMNVYMGKESLLPEPRTPSWHSWLFGSLGVIAALLLGSTLAWAVWGKATQSTPTHEVPSASSVVNSATNETLEVPFTVNNSTNLTASLGDILAARMVVHNLTQEPLDHVVLTLDAYGSLFDTGTVKIPFGHIQGTTITIDESTLPLLAHMPARASIPLSFSFGIVPFVPESMKVSSEPALVSLKLTSTATRTKGRIPAWVSEVNIKVHSDTQLLPQVRYFSPQGEQIGRGPLPPEVGNKTTYWIYFRIENILNNVENAVLTVRFAPQNVGWTGRTSTNMGSDFLFDPFLKSASWIIGTIPANRSFTGIPPSAALEVYAAPHKGMRDTVPLLLEDIVLSGKDTYTGALLEKRYTHLTADLAFDEQGKTRGVTVK